MKKTVLMSAAKKARIALAVMAVCGFTFAGAQSAFAEIHISGNDNTYTDAKDFSTIVGSKNNLTGKDYDGEITKFTVLGSENRVNAFYQYILSEDLAKKNQITVVGTKNNIKGTRNTVVGDNNTVEFNESIVLGKNNSLSPWTLYRDTGKNILIGNDISAQINDSNIAIGNKMTVQGSWNSTLIGNEIKNYGASEAVILGSNINAAYGRSVMVGNRTWAHGNSVALGYNAVAAVAGAEALGARSRAEKYFSVAIGYGSLADEENTVSVGSNKERTITELNGTTTTIPTRYRRIVNMADGINNHDAATFGQIIKKDTYTISLDDTGNGNVLLKTNADKEGPTIKVDASALETQIKKNASDITAVDGKVGTLGADGTYIKQAKNVSENLVALDTQVKRNADDISIANSTIYNVSSKIGTKYDGNYIGATNTIGSDLVALDNQVKVNADAIGTLTNLTTTEKTNLVGAVNEVKGAADAAQTKANDAFTQANTNKASIGTLSSLTTTEKTNLVGAVNEVKGTADTALGLANTNKDNIGTLTNLTTTEKGNLVGAINEVKGSVDAANTAIAGKADLDLGNISTAGETKIKDLASIKAGEVVADKLGAITSTNYVSASGKVNANISVLDKQVKANADDIIEANTKITNVDNKIGSLSTDGTYIKKANNVSANLVELDKQLNTNATAITNKANQDLSNINAAGENIIKNLAGNKAGEIVDTKLGDITSENYVKKTDTVNANISALDKQVKANADGIIAANTKITAVDNKIGSLSADGKYIKKANNVSENLVELDKQVNTNATAITTKANLDLSNINAAGENVIKNLAGNKAGEIVDVKLGAITSTHYVNAGNTVNANISALDTQLNKVENKIGTMTDGNYISAGNTVAGNLSALDNQLKANTEAINTKADKDLSNITDAGKNVIKDLAGNKAGEIVDTKLGDITSENYVNKTNTVNANISKLDEQVKANADAINTKADKDLSNITDAGKNVIKDLAGNKAGEVVDAKLGDITSENYVKKDDTVNANISALDKQMKANTDNIGDTGKLTAAGLGSNLSDAVVKVNDKVGTADELKVLKDAGLGDNLAQATAAVNKKADKNADDIKTVNGRVDELGGRVDTLGGAVSKLDTKVNKVGAGAAALAALHPMDFDSDNKLTFAAGVGNYRGANAAAIGAFYRPNEQVMFSIAGNMGNGENMVNAGVSFALDRPSQTPTTKAALVKTVAAQNEQIAALNETVAEQNEKIARLEAMVEKLVAKQNA